MKNKFLMTGFAAALLIMAAGCKTTATTATTATTDTTQTTASTSANLDTGTTSTTVATTPATPSTTVATTPDNGTTTTTLPNGTTVTRSETTTVVLPNGQVQTTGTPTSTTMASSSSTDTTAASVNPATLPPGSVVTKTTTTIKTTQSQPAAAVATTTTQPATVYVNNPPPMTSSTTIYQPYRSGYVRRFPNTSFLVFGSRASFSNSNTALSPTLNSGNLRSDFNNETGYGIGINQVLGASNFSLEFTGSRIRPRASFTPSNSTFNPVTGLRIRMTPVTGALQLHMNPRSSVDFYVGAGAAYVFFRPDNTFAANNLGLANVKIKDEWGPMANAGLGFNFSPHFGLNFDAKYMWIRANTTTTYNNNVIVGNVGNTERFGLNPFMLSAGLRFGF